MTLNKRKIKKKNIDYINIDFGVYANFTNIILGNYKPVLNFFNKAELQNVLKKNKLINGNKWTIPILFNVIQRETKKIKINQLYYLKYNNKVIGKIIIDSIFRINKNIYCSKVFNTNSIKRPGVKKIKKMHNFFISCSILKVKYLSTIKEKYINDAKIKNHDDKLKLKKVSFTTRNIPHLGHLYLLNNFNKSQNINLCIVILINDKNKFSPKIIKESYLKLTDLFIKKRKVSVYQLLLPSFFAGPNEAFLQAVIMKNIGFNSFIVGRDHAGVSNFYLKYGSQKIFKNNDLINLQIIKTKEPIRCKKCFKLFFENEIICRCDGKIKNTENFSGTIIRKYIKQNNIIKLNKLLHTTTMKIINKNRLIKI